MSNEQAKLHYFTDLSNNPDGTESVSGAEKIVAVKLIENAKNPFLQLMLQPTSSEAIAHGGSLTRFIKKIGIDLPERKSKNYVNNVIDYAEGFKFKHEELLVNNPYTTKNYPVQKDSIQLLDGVAIDALGIEQIPLSLAKGEVDAMAKVFTNNDESIKVDGTSISNSREKIKIIKKHTTKYLAISADNPNWNNNTKVFENFVGQRHAFDKSDLLIYIHPHTYDDTLDSFIDLNTSDYVAGIYIQGNKIQLNGIEIIITKEVPEGKLFITPKKIIGTPASDLLGTKVYSEKVTGQAGNSITYGLTYFDAKVIYPELITVIDFGSHSAITESMPSATITSVVKTLATASDATDGEVTANVEASETTNPRVVILDSTGSQVGSPVTLTNDVAQDATFSGLGVDTYSIEVIDGNFGTDSSIASYSCEISSSTSPYLLNLEKETKTLSSNLVEKDKYITELEQKLKKQS